jgi:heme-degrading monooxygenase HmoA
MSFFLVRHKVEDYVKWKAGFDEHAKTREAAGSKGGRLFRSVLDSNEVIILLEWDSMAKARLFAQSEDLKEAMKRAGVSDQPDLYFIEEVDRPSA